MLIEELMACARRREAHPIWASAHERLRLDRNIVEAQLALPNCRIYGFNTLPGHRDGASLQPGDFGTINQQIFLSHIIGAEPFHDDFTARCIGYAKLFALYAGGSGLSPELFGKLAGVVIDEGFRPMIPVRASYSSGDVIPAAHWAHAALVHAGIATNSLLAGEAMALINGRFVQVGAAIAMLPLLQRFWAALFESTALLFSFPGLRRDSLQAVHTAERAAVSMALRALIDRLSFTDIRHPAMDQASVSIRAFPQIIEGLFISASHLAEEIEYILYKPSCNPYFQDEYPHYVSQASFLAPVLTTSISSVTDQVLFAGAMIVQRLSFLLSGNIPGIPIDGARGNDLGLIQVPKLMTAKLEILRSALNGRLAAQHVSTSLGREDIASYGLIAIEQLRTAVDGVMELIKYEMAALGWLARESAICPSSDSLPPSNASGNFAAILQAMETTFESDNLAPWSKPFFPVEC